MMGERFLAPVARDRALLREVKFSFDVKREPENHQRFRRAGSTNQGLLALDNPKEDVETEKS